MDPDVLKLLAGGGFGAALLALIYTIGVRLVASNDRTGERTSKSIERFADAIVAHTTTDLAAHAETREALAHLHGKIDGLLDASDRLTPVGVEIPEAPRRTPIRGVTTYGPSRPGTKGDR